MKRSLVLASLVALTVTIAAGSAHTQPSNQSFQFLGLWEGVDINDGSKRTISITDRDGDGVLDVASHDTYWTLCDGDRGIELATGRVGADHVLHTTGLVTCFEGEANVPVTQTYELSRQDDTLLATPHGAPLMPITLHRISGGRGTRP